MRTIILNKHVFCILMLFAALCLTASDCDDEKLLKAHIKRMEEDVKWTRQRADDEQRERRGIERRARGEKAELQETIQIEQTRRTWSDLYALAAAFGLTTVLVLLWRRIRSGDSIPAGEE